MDSTCSEDELQETQGELEKCLKDPTLVGIPLLVLCNKQDLAEAKPVEQVGGIFCGKGHVSNQRF